jgi:hypothetical protein
VAQNADGIEFLTPTIRSEPRLESANHLRAKWRSSTSHQSCAHIVLDTTDIRDRYFADEFDAGLRGERKCCAGYFSRSGSLQTPIVLDRISSSGVTFAN